MNSIIFAFEPEKICSANEEFGIVHHATRVRSDRIPCSWDWYLTAIHIALMACSSYLAQNGTEFRVADTILDSLERSSCILVSTAYSDDGSIIYTYAWNAGRKVTTYNSDIPHSTDIAFHNIADSSCWPSMPPWSAMLSFWGSSFLQSLDAQSIRSPLLIVM